MWPVGLVPRAVSRLAPPKRKPRPQPFRSRQRLDWDLPALIPVARFGRRWGEAARAQIEDEDAFRSGGRR